MRRAKRLAAAGDSAGAMMCLATAADLGSVEAEVSVGLAYLSGAGVPRNLAAAASWLTRAAANGHGRAQVLAASLCLQGYKPRPGGFSADETPGQPDIAGAYAWAQLAADNGEADGQALLGFLLTSGPASLQDKAAALKWYRDGVAGGSSQACLGLALLLLENGQPVGEAAQLIRRAAQARLPLAMYLLGDMLEHGHGVDRDPKEATRWFSNAAEAGLAAARGRIGQPLATSGVDR